jgi:pimeloyl-ACP methyl ester carboxylesterase
MKHLDVKQINQLQLIFSSPDLSWNDVRWIMGMLNLKKHYVRNKKLLDYVLLADAYSIAKAYRSPVHFVSGEYDKHCRVEMVQEYCESINAPMKSMSVIKKCGHSPQIDNVKETASVIRNILLG